MATDAERLEGLDILKFVSIISVIITHYSFSISDRRLFLFPFYINMAVPVFMVLSGYCNALSLKKKGSVYPLDVITKKYVLDRLIKIVIPFFLIFLLEVVCFKLYKNYSVITIVTWFFQGGHGPGSYYFPILVQFIFLFPYIYYLMNYFKEKGLFYAFLVNIIYEIVVRFYNIPEELYRLLIFRYFFLIASGCFFAIGLKIPLKKSILMIVIGGAWIVFTQYFNYSPVVFRYWTETNLFSALYIIPIVSFIIEFLIKYPIKHSIKYRFFSILGKKTYYIFLIQMFYYYFLYCTNYYLYDFLPNKIVILFMNIFICIGGGRDIFFNMYSTF